MLTISKSLSGGQARTYHAREFSSEKANYWSRDQQGHSEWQGRLAQQWGLEGSVDSEHFARLTEGQHPEIQAQMVRHQPAKTYANEQPTAPAIRKSCNRRPRCCTGIVSWPPSMATRRIGW